MATIALFHSVLGLRQVEHAAAERLRAAGHTVVVPDLYDGVRRESVEAGFEVRRAIGWKTICDRARAALSALPETTVLAGHSMGAAVAGEMWAQRPSASAIVLLHALADIAPNARAGTPVCVHVADPDRFAPPEALAEWQANAATAGLAAEVFTYPGLGHFYTDEASPDHDAAAAAKTWERVLAFLDTVAPPKA